MKVKIKTWGEMAREFGVDRWEDIKNPDVYFNRQMEALLPDNRIIKVLSPDKNNISLWPDTGFFIAASHIAEYLDEEKPSFKQEAFTVKEAAKGIDDAIRNFSKIGKAFAKDKEPAPPRPEPKFKIGDVVDFLSVHNSAPPPETCGLRIVRHTWLTGDEEYSYKFAEVAYSVSEKHLVLTGEYKPAPSLPEPRFKLGDVVEVLGIEEVLRIREITWLESDKAFWYFFDNHLYGIREKHLLLKNKPAKSAEIVEQLIESDPSEPKFKQAPFTIKEAAKGIDDAIRNFSKIGKAFAKDEKPAPSRPDKPPMDLVDLDFVAAMSLNMLKGIKGDRVRDDWKKMDWNEEAESLYRSKLLRHAKDHDWAAVACNAMILFLRGEK